MGKGNYKGNDISGEYRWTVALCANEDGGWQLVGSHGSSSKTND